jgi:hypothetical protein
MRFSIQAELRCLVVSGIVTNRDFVRIVSTYVHFTYDAACGCVLLSTVFVLQPVWSSAVHVNSLFYVLL